MEGEGKIPKNKAFWTIFSSKRDHPLGEEIIKVVKTNCANKNHLIGEYWLTFCAISAIIIRRIKGLEGKIMAVRLGTFSYNTIQYTYSDARVIPHGGLIIAGQMLQASSFDSIVNQGMKENKEYKNSDILKPFLMGTLIGEPDFESIHFFDDDPEYYCNAFHMRRMPSEATMRLRMDEIGDTLKSHLRQVNISMFKKYGVVPSALDNGYVPIDIDVSPFINEKCKKEGISKTYKMKDGYAPIFAYIGTEGYLLACELREGKQHCQKGTPDFLREVIDLARQITDQPLRQRCS